MLDRAAGSVKARSSTSTSKWYDSNMPEEPNEGENPESFSEPPPFFSQNFGETEGDVRELVEVTIDAVYARDDSLNREHFVVLRDGDRRLSIMIDPCNALAISRPLEGSVPDRPLTHDLFKTVMDRLSCEVVKIVIDDLWSTTYYAKMILKSGDEEMEIDSRPSDAIAIAARFGSPIFVSESIMSTASED